jgi:hypothetical protein
MAASTFASAASTVLSFFQVLLCISAALILLLPLRVLRSSTAAKNSPQPPAPR